MLCVIVVGPKEFVVGKKVHPVDIPLLNMMQSVFPHGKCFFWGDLKQIEGGSRDQQTDRIREASVVP
jgi:hypothetical protein